MRSDRIENRTDCIRIRRHVIRLTVVKATDGVQEGSRLKDEGEDRDWMIRGLQSRTDWSIRDLMVDVLSGDWWDPDTVGHDSKGVRVGTRFARSQH
jgi:hypothetical protein